MHIQIIAALPEIFKALDYGIPKQAQRKGQLELTLHHLRDFTQDKHRRIDDRPYGGGPGMVLRAEPVLDAIECALQKVPHGTLVSYLSPHGKRFDQKAAHALSQRSHLILVAGRYEGIDERVYAVHPHESWSLGDFVLSGGETAALCMIDAISRLLPDVVGNAESIAQDSFSLHSGLLDHPHYTRPASVRGLDVPPVLLSGNHNTIAKWRREKAVQQTKMYRPDLFYNYLSDKKE